jgi:adenosine 3'-phospho 5'-phosphosulfate transporter B2
LKLSETAQIHWQQHSSMAPSSPEETAWSSAVWCVTYGAGIIGMLVVYGVLQERIMSEPYGTDYFKASVFLVLCNRLVAIVYSLCMILAKGESLTNAAPLWKYLAISFSNVGATTCQYEALKYVSFPVQMLGKSFKMMPVMCWGIIISRKKYTLNDWLIAAAITGGVTEFLLTGSIASKRAAGNSAFGLLLLLLFLGLDGFTSTFQEKLFKEHTTSKYNQMLYVNLGSATVSLFTLITTGSMWTAFSFISAHPGLLTDAGMLSAAAVAAQWFIYSQVKEFGALVFAATMNVRQITSIIISYIKYGHSISWLQVLGLVFVFGALFYKSYDGLTKTKDKEPLLSDKDIKIKSQAKPESA